MPQRHADNFLRLIAKYLVNSSFVEYPEYGAITDVISDWHRSKALLGRTRHHPRATTTAT